MLAAIQWHISDHLGLSREGASGSVSVTMYVIFVVAQPSGLVSSCRVIDGWSWRCFGLTVFPSEAFFFDHETERVREGRKSSTTVGFVN